MKAVFVPLLEASDKGTALHSVVADQAGRSVDPSVFSSIPGSAFAYWVTPSLAGTFARLPAFEGDGRTAKLGIKTDDDFRFLRAWTEAPSDGSDAWSPFSKGGAFSRYYADIDLVVLWDRQGEQMKALSIQRWGNAGKRIYNTQFFHRPGLTWSARSQTGFSARVSSSSRAFGHRGPTSFIRGDRPDELLHYLAVFNSSTFRSLIALQMAFGTYEVGVIQRTAIPSVEADAELAARVKHAWSISRAVDSGSETSHAFVIPGVFSNEANSIEELSAARVKLLREAEAALSLIQSEIDDICFDLYGIDEADRRAITEGFTVAAADEVHVDGQASEESDGEDSESELTPAADSSALTADLLSWCVGVAVGRFDIRFATGEREPPSDPDPFDPVPVCSPGMLTGEDGLPVDAVPVGYPLAWPEDGVLVDDPGHPRDLTAAVREVFEVVFGSAADAFWTEASELVDPRSQDIRRWLQRTFFQEHIKRYSKSRRKAPIYWQLATPSASYSVWLYAHRIGRDSLYQVLNDFVSPKLQAEERKLHALREEAGESPSSSQRKELAAQESFVSELRVLRDEVARVAPLWNPDLNDGVVIVTAPLYRLVPQLKSWQKELKTHWDAFCAGKYDWAQLAMHLWPEQVVPKCAEDRSLAIAHDLEDVFWEQDAEGKWSPREEPARPVSELVAERTSSAVKDALESLRSAPALVGARPVRGSRG